MKGKGVVMAHVYTLEGHDHFSKVLEILREEEEVAGVTVVRGIAGFGVSGQIHTSSLLNLSLELPLVIEFYDEPKKVAHAIETLRQRLDLKHIVSWPAKAHIDSSSA